MGTRVLVAMSGGVDSSVAAARLVDRGHDVVGVTLHLWDYPDDSVVQSRCCAPEDVHDARRVADELGIAHYSFDRRELFARTVVEPFVDGYLAGETPSPCVACNRSVKMAELFALADRLAADKVATGHYARAVARGASVELHRGRDPNKDQSYFLHTLSREQLARIDFPLGDATKTEVRDEALRRGLPGAGKGESQELCFVPTGRYDAFVEARAGARVRPGPIFAADGQQVGSHGGVHGFTIGQRKGLGVALGTPAFVVGIDAENAAVHLGAPGDLFSSAIRLDEATFYDDVSLPVRGFVQVRYRHAPVSATVMRDEGGVVVRFDDKVRAIAKGQVAVIYDGDRVLGGGAIREALA